MNEVSRLKRAILLMVSATFLNFLPGFKAVAQQTTPPKPSAPRKVDFPRPVERTLHNGLRVIVVERHDLPLATAEVIIKNGAETDGPELAGLAQMTAALLRKGTTTRTAPEIAEAIEALGGSLHTSAGWDASTAAVDAMSSRLPQAMEILADVVRRPVFKDEEIERLRAQTLDNVHVALGQPGSLARYVASRVVFGDASYGHMLSGTPESLQRIKRSDVVNLHAGIYRSRNAILVIGGDIKPNDAFNLAEKQFGDWSGGTQPISPVGSESTPAPGSRVIVVDKPDAGQAAVLLASRGINRADKDYFNGIVANTVLGGGYSARLNEEIRIKRGLSYGAGSSLDARRSPGPFVESAQTKNESAGEVASLLIGELGRLGSAPVLDDEMTPRKATLIGNFARNLETVNGLVGHIASLALYDLSLDEINWYVSNVQSVTSSALQQFVNSHLKAETANVIIVGNGKMFLDDVRKRFPLVEVIPISDLDLNSASLRRSAKVQSKTGY